ncbi:MAG: sulfatase-like hydrolase/transferase, partial [Microlunatus sp.]|nr:sulfatase-like hydrolase/transferase [Microlunatus sp.]
AAEMDRPEPFYLSLHFTAPHSPWRGQHPEEFTARYTGCAFESCPQGPLHPWTPLDLSGRPLGGESDTWAALIGYFAAVTAMDAALGRVLAKLADHGLRESTLVVFSSDNGFNAGQHGVWGKGNGPFPQNMYDSSVKVPAIISQPGRIGVGVCSGLLSAYDLGATVLELAGVPHQALERGPGRSFADLLTPRRDSPDPSQPAERSRVIVFDEYGPVRMIRTCGWKYVHRYPDGPHELYDLASDPDEADNLASTGRHRATVAWLREELDVWFRRHADPARDGSGLPVIGTGQRARVGDGAAFQGPLWLRTAGDQSPTTQP